MDNSMQNKKYTFSQFVMKVINGATAGILVAVIPNAIFGEIFINLIPLWEGFNTLEGIVQVIQFLMPVLIGVGVGIQFNLNPMQLMSVGGASFIASGNVIRIEDTWHITGIGDTVNAMLIAGIATWIVLKIGDKLATLATIAYSTVIAAGVGAIGVFILPYVSYITEFLGQVVASATDLQPIIMSIIIGILFAILILTPISVVAIAMAISLSGFASGAANLGLVAVVVFMAMGSAFAKNEFGVTLSIILGGVKSTMPNFFANLKIAIPVILTSGFMGALSPILNIQGTPASAGLGFAGLVGPIVAYDYLEYNAIINILILLLVYLIIPILICLFAHWLCINVIKVTKVSDYKINLK